MVLLSLQEHDVEAICKQMILILSGVLYRSLRDIVIHIFDQGEFKCNIYIHYIRTYLMP